VREPRITSTRPSRTEPSRAAVRHMRIKIHVKKTLLRTRERPQPTTPILSETAETHLTSSHNTLVSTNLAGNASHRPRGLRRQIKRTTSRSMSLLSKTQSLLRPLPKTTDTNTQLPRDQNGRPTTNPASPSSRSDGRTPRHPQTLIHQQHTSR